jgi:hypothetical protein
MAPLDEILDFRPKINIATLYSSTATSTEKSSSSTATKEITFLPLANKGPQ